MMYPVEVCAACGTRLGPRVLRVNQNDPSAYVITVVICRRCRQSWTPAESKRVAVKVEEELDRYACYPAAPSAPPLSALTEAERVSVLSWLRDRRKELETLVSMPPSDDT